MMDTIEASNMGHSSILLRVQILLIVLLVQTAFHSSPAMAQTSPPSVSIAAPTKNAILHGFVTVTIQASSPDGIHSVEALYVQGVIQQDIPPGPKLQYPYTWTWNTSAVQNGTYTLQALAFDNNGNSNTASINITIANGPSSAPALTPGSIGLVVVVLVLAAVGVMVLYKKRSRSHLNLPRTTST